MRHLSDDLVSITQLAHDKMLSFTTQNPKTQACELNSNLKNKSE